MKLGKSVSDSVRTSVWYSVQGFVYDLSSSVVTDLMYSVKSQIENRTRI